MILAGSGGVATHNGQPDYVLTLIVGTFDAHLVCIVFTSQRANFYVLFDNGVEIEMSTKVNKIRFSTKFQLKQPKTTHSHDNFENRGL